MKIEKDKLGFYKSCKKCSKVFRHKTEALFSSDFSRNRCRADGYEIACKSCDSKRYKSKEYKARKIELYNPLKRKARAKVAGAISSGKLVKKPCKKCGSTKRIEAHHENYKRPLLIVWLCKKHHTEVHHGEAE